MGLITRTRRYVLRHLRGIESIDTIRGRCRSFDEIRSAVLKRGTDSRRDFGTDYELEGGLCLQQNSWEITALICLLMERLPINRYLEIGSASGGTCRLLHEMVGLNDITSLDDGMHPCAFMQRENLSGLHIFRQFRGDSHSKQAMEFLRRELPGKLDVAFVDGDHSEAGVWMDIQLVEPFLANGAWLILHDTVACPGVQRSWLRIAYGRNFRPLAELIGMDHSMGIAVAKYLGTSGDQAT